MFDLKVTLQQLISIKFEEELGFFIGSNMRGDRKLDENVSTEILTGSDVSYCSKSMLKPPRTKISLSFPYKGSLTMTL